MPWLKVFFAGLCFFRFPAARPIVFHAVSGPKCLSVTFQRQKKKIRKPLTLSFPGIHALGAATLPLVV